MSSDPYSARVRELFEKPEHAGTVEGGCAARVDDQGMRVELSASSSGDRISSLGFRAWGCPHLIAAAEAFCAGFEDRAVADLESFVAAELMQSLPVPVEKTGRILVLEDTVRKLRKTLLETSTTGN